MPKVTMLKTQRGSEDGIRLDTHEAGETYDLTEYLSGVYVREGWAVPVEELAAPVAAPEPVVRRSPQDKMAKAPQRRKQGGKRA